MFWVNGFCFFAVFLRNTKEYLCIFSGVCQGKRRIHELPADERKHTLETGRRFTKNHTSMGKFNQDRGNKQMFHTTCANCGKSCDVPFQPKGDRPVYCRECFPRFRNQNRPQQYQQNRPASSGNLEGQILGQIKGLHEKIDLLLSLQKPVVKEPKKTAEKPKKPAKAKKGKKK